MEGEVDEVREMLAGGIQVDAVDEEGRTALMAAAAFDQTEVVNVLLDAGTDIHKTCPAKRTALMYAAANCTATVQRLLLLGAQVNASDSVGGTALICACQQNAANVGVLLAAGAEVNRKDIYGCSPLYFACGIEQPGSEDAVTALLAAGADASAANKMGQTPLVGWVGLGWVAVCVYAGWRGRCCAGLAGWRGGLKLMG